RALYDFDSNESTNLSFKRNDIIQVLTQLESGWWDGLCNGERGWFPSNYVTAYEGNHMLDEDEKLIDWITQHTPDGDAFYYNTKTGESSWELPIDDNESYSSTYTTSGNSNSRTLPENWVQQPTVDGRFYYYNVITKEIKWTYPKNGTMNATSSNSDISEYKDDEIELQKNYLKNDKIEDKASIINSKDSQTSNDTIQQMSQQRRSIENLSLIWTQKFTAQGRVFYYNKLTGETTWNFDNINADGQLMKVGDEILSNGGESGDEDLHEPLSPTPTLSMYSQPKIFSEDSILPNVNELVTWDSLLQNIILAIDNLNLAVLENLKQNYTSYTNAIVESVRIMLYASGTIEKDSPAIKHNKNLKVYHRRIMASLSKLVLSTKVASDVWPPPDSTQKLKNDAYEVLVAVRQFVQASEHIVVIRRVDPRILESTIGGSWRGNSNLLQTQKNGKNGIIRTNDRIPNLPSISSSISSQENNSIPNSPTHLYSQSRSLSNDLIASLDQTSRNISQTIVSLLSHVNKVIDTPHSISSSNISFASQLISQTKQVVTQVGQFLSLIEDINLDDLNESSLDTINEFKIAKQSTYNSIAGLVICIQSATDPLAPLNVMDQVLIATNKVDKAVADVVLATKFLVEEKDAQEQMKIQAMRPRRPSTVEVPPTKRRITSNSNSLDQIVETDLTTTDQSMTLKEAQSSTAGIKIVPEDDIIINDGDSTIVDLSSDDHDLPMSPISTNESYRLRSDSSVSSSTYNDALSFQTHSRSNSQFVSASADYPYSSSPPLTIEGTSGTISPRSENKVKKFFGEIVPHSHKQKEDKPWFLNHDYDQSEMIFNMEGYVKGGTLNALIERLTMHDLLDSNFIATFLLTYRSFCTTDEFFDRLVKRFMIQSPDNLTHDELEVWQEKKQTPIRIRVFNIMKTWLEYYYIDGEDSHCLERMSEFANTTMNEKMSFATKGLMKLIEKRVCKNAKFKELVITNSDKPPASILPKNIKKLKFLELDPLEIARQLTLIESKLYNKILPVECLNKAWSKDEGDYAAVNIKAMIVNSNQITGWVAESVLDQLEIKKRCLCIKHFVAVADKCRTLNNFNSLTAIISGLNSAPIHRLKRTWELVNSKTIQTLESLNKIMNSTKNFAEYRELIHSVNPPCVPFLGVYLTDLTFIEDGNPNNLKKSRLINFSKRMKTAEVIREIQQYQSAPYNLNSIQEIQAFIKCRLQNSRDVADLYDISLSMEPREREDEKIARLLQESGFL
ncbi:2452_t:CDS:2, partial [Funneliformis geosporum]